MIVMIRCRSVAFNKGPGGAKKILKDPMLFSDVENHFWFFSDAVIPV
jgi:hypothetical protein